MLSMRNQEWLSMGTHSEFSRLDFNWIEASGSGVSGTSEPWRSEGNFLADPNKNT